MACYMYSNVKRETGRSPFLGSFVWFSLSTFFLNLSNLVNITEMNLQYGDRAMS